jgi:hypothetical protein
MGKRVALGIIPVTLLLIVACIEERAGIQSPFPPLSQIMGEGVAAAHLLPVSRQVIKAVEQWMRVGQLTPLPVAAMQGMTLIPAFQEIEPERIVASLSP